MDANQAVAYVAYRLSEGCGPCRATTDVATADNMQNPLELRTAKVQPVQIYLATKLA